MSSRKNRSPGPPPLTCVPSSANTDDKRERCAALSVDNDSPCLTLLFEGYTELGTLPSGIRIR